MEADGESINPGSLVSISGLKKRTDLNEKIGRVVEEISGTGRWAIEIEGGEVVRILEKNLAILEEDPEEEEDEEHIESDVEEEEEEEDEEEEQEEELATLQITRKQVTDRLGLDFASESDLTLSGVTPGTCAENTDALQLVGWKLTHINENEVCSLSDAGKFVSKSKTLDLQFIRPATHWITMPKCESVPEKVLFTIPSVAPLNPNSKIEIGRSKSGDALIYKVDGKPRPKTRSLHFHILGEHYTRELRFPDLGCCMWLPADGFSEIYSSLRSLAMSIPGIQLRGFSAKFKESSINEIEQLEAAKEDELTEAKKKRAIRAMKNFKKKKHMMKAAGIDGKRSKHG